MAAQHERCTKTHDVTATGSASTTTTQKNARRWPGSVLIGALAALTDSCVLPHWGRAITYCLPPSLSTPEPFRQG